MLAMLANSRQRIRLIWGDGGYAGQLLDWVRGLQPRNRIRMEIVKRSDAVRGFKVSPHRWVVERTFGWIGRQRRLSKDYEFLTATSEAMIRVTMIAAVLRRLATRAF